MIKRKLRNLKRSPVNVLNRTVDRLALITIKPLLLTVGVKRLMKETGVSKSVAQREIRSAIKRRFRTGESFKKIKRGR